MVSEKKISMWKVHNGRQVMAKAHMALWVIKYWVLKQCIMDMNI